MRCTDIVGSMLGESERALTDIFTRARKMKPCIIVLDQIEAIGRKRGQDDTDERTWDRLLSCLLIELDGMRKNEERSSRTSSGGGGSGGGSGGVHVIGTTSDLTRLDPALIRPGRFDDCILINYPIDNEIKALILLRFKKAMAICEDKGQEIVLVLDDIVQQMRGMSRADIVGLCREAVMSAIRENSQNPILRSRHVFNLLK